MANKDSNQKLGQKLAEMNAVVPGIMAHRLIRMALTSASPSSSDRAELTRMTSEKWLAASSSTIAMATFAIETQMAMVQSFWQAAFWPWMGHSSRTSGGYGAMTDAMSGLLNAGVAPYHRIATANSRRLAKRRLASC